MTKSNRGFEKFAGSNPFDQSANPSLVEADAQIYGQSGTPAIITGRIVARPISIFEIVPDPTQPRRAVPSQVMDMWNRSPETVGDMLGAWFQMASQEAGVDEIPVAAHLLGEETERSTSEAERKIGPLEHGFMDLVELAASIRRDGLNQPIMVSPSDNGVYQIVFGERRWLAHHLLSGVFHDDDTFRKIAAAQTDKADVWKQATENNNRAPLNAVGKARQLALLLMAVYAEQGHTFQPYETFNSDREFYAQVADGNTFPIPYGAGERIVQAMGLKHLSQLRQFRALLRLPDHYWRIGDDQGWTENRLREYLKEIRESVTTVTHLAQEDENLADEGVSAPTPLAQDDQQDFAGVEPSEDDDRNEAAQEPVVIVGSGMQTSPQGNPGGLTDPQMRAILSMYKLAQRNPARGWVRPDQISAHPAFLNQLAESGYIDCKTPGNVRFDVAGYRVNAVGAQTIGMPPIDFARYEPPPAQYPGNDIYAGTELAQNRQIPTGSTPPRAASPKPRMRKLITGDTFNSFEALMRFYDKDALEYPAVTGVHVQRCREALDRIEQLLETGELPE